MRANRLSPKAMTRGKVVPCAEPVRRAAVWANSSDNLNVDLAQAHEERCEPGEEHLGRRTADGHGRGEIRCSKR